MKIIKSILVISLIFALSAGMSAAQDKVSVTVACGAVGIEKELTDQAADMYMQEHPNVEVKVLDTPDLATDRLGLYLQFFEAKSAEVDVYQIDVIWPGDLAEHLVDLYQYEGFKEAGLDHETIKKLCLCSVGSINASLQKLGAYGGISINKYRSDSDDYCIEEFKKKK